MNIRMMERDLTDAELVDLEVRARAHGTYPRNEPMLSIVAELRRRRAAEARSIAPSIDLLMSVRAFERAMQKRDAFARAHAVVSTIAEERQVQAQVALFAILVQRAAEAVATLAARELASLLSTLPQPSTRQEARTVVMHDPPQITADPFTSAA